MQNIQLLCCWENVVKFWDVSCSTVTTYPPQIRCACSIQSASTFRERNECSSIKSFSFWIHFANTKFFPQQQGSTFRQHHLVSTTPRLHGLACVDLWVSCHMTNVVKWPNVIANYLENDNVMLLKRREKSFRESTPCFCGINSFFFPKKYRDNNQWIKLCVRLRSIPIVKTSSGRWQRERQKKKSNRLNKQKKKKLCTCTRERFFSLSELGYGF